MCLFTSSCRAREIYHTHTRRKSASSFCTKLGRHQREKMVRSFRQKERISLFTSFLPPNAHFVHRESKTLLWFPAGGNTLETRKKRFLSLSYSLSSPLANALADTETFLSLVPLSCFRCSPTRNVNNNKQVVSEKEQKSSTTNGLFSKLFSSNKNNNNINASSMKGEESHERPLPPSRGERFQQQEQEEQQEHQQPSTSSSAWKQLHSAQSKLNAANAMKRGAGGKAATTLSSGGGTTTTKMSAGTKKAMKSSREAKFRNYLNLDGTLDKLTRALDDLLRSNVKPESPADWLVARLSDDYANKLKEAQEDLEEQVKENEKLKERLDKSRSFVHRLQEDVEDLTKKLEEEKEMAEAVAARAMHEPQEVEMLKEELREVMEDANEMADLIREYEQREEERLAVRSVKKELQEERERVYGNGTLPSPRSSDASSKRLMRFEEIKEKVRRQHEDAQKYKQNRSGGTSPTASDMSSQYVEEDNAPKYTRSASKRITESEGKMLF